MSGPSDDASDDSDDSNEEFDAISAVIAREFPTRPVTDRSSVATGNRKRTVVVRFGDGSDPRAVVVQTGPNERALATEATLTRAIAARTDLPVAQALAGGPLSSIDETSETSGGYLVTEQQSGTDLHEQFATLDAFSQQTIAQTFGRALACLHDAFRFDGYGAVSVEHDRAVDWHRILTDSDPGAALGVDTSGDHIVTDRDHTAAVHDSVAGDDDHVAVTADWPTWVQSYASAGVDRLPPAFDDLRPRLRTMVDAGVASLPSSPVSTLYPWDLRPGNALAEGGTVTALLDWGEPLAAAPGLGVAKVEHLVCDWYVADAGPLRRAFRTGYADVRPLPSVPDVYRLAAVVASAVDGEGVITRPRYPERTGEAAVAFHRERLAAILD